MQNRQLQSKRKSVGACSVGGSLLVCATFQQPVRLEFSDAICPSLMDGKVAPAIAANVTPAAASKTPKKKKGGGKSGAAPNGADAASQGTTQTTRPKKSRKNNGASAGDDAPASAEYAQNGGAKAAKPRKRKQTGTSGELTLLLVSTCTSVSWN